MPSDPLPPGSTVGILGGGQLGRMLTLAAARLGLKCHIFCPDAESPAFDVAATKTVADYADLDALDAFARAVDVVTYEFENIEVSAAERLAASVPVRPGPRALEVTQDRLVEKRFLRGLGIDLAAFEPVEDPASLNAAAGAIGLPAVLKTRRLGYDGKGQVRLAAESDVAPALAAIDGRPAVLERLISFSREISIIAARGVGGETVFYDVPENVHRGGILHTSTVPARVSPATASVAAEIARTVLEALDYVGVLAIEFFVVGEGSGERLLVNEIAPRVHNSGHWTADACAASQFENHIRAVAGWPLAPAARHSNAVMTNLIGSDVDAWPLLAREAGACVHLYGKREARAGRKMGHVTRLAPRA